MRSAPRARAGGDRSRRSRSIRAGRAPLPAWHVSVVAQAGTARSELGGWPSSDAVEQALGGLWPTSNSLAAP